MEFKGVINFAQFEGGRGLPVLSLKKGEGSHVRFQLSLNVSFVFKSYQKSDGVSILSKLRRGRSHLFV